MPVQAAGATDSAIWPSQSIRLTPPRSRARRHSRFLTSRCQAFSCRGPTASHIARQRCDSARVRSTGDHSRDRRTTTHPPTFQHPQRHQDVRTTDTTGGPVSCSSHRSPACLLARSLSARGDDVPARVTSLAISPLISRLPSEPTAIGRRGIRAMELRLCFRVPGTARPSALADLSTSLTSHRAASVMLGALILSLRVRRATESHRGGVSFRRQSSPRGHSAFNHGDPRRDSG